MLRETLHPENEAAWLALRTQDLTSTDVAALFGLSPYKTHFELWHEKKIGEVVRLDENERMKWGRRLEATVAEGIAADAGWAVRPMKEYMRLPELRIGASFDFRVMTPSGKCVPGVADLDDWVNLADSDRDAHLEIKCVDWLVARNNWTLSGDFIEAPAHIELQVQHQMLVSGLRRAYIGVMVGGNDVRVIEREADDGVRRGIMSAARAFWASIEANIPPPPVMPDDADAVIALHQYAEPGRLYDARNDDNVKRIVREYAELGDAKRKAEEAQKVRKAELLAAIGDADRVMVDGYSVSCGLVGPAEIPAYTRDGYRLVRVTPKKASAPKTPQEGSQ